MPGARYRAPGSVPRMAANAPNIQMPRPENAPRPIRPFAANIQHIIPGNYPPRAHYVEFINPLFNPHGGDEAGMDDFFLEHKLQAILS